MTLVRNTYFSKTRRLPALDVRPLVYDPVRSHFPPNTPISMIVKNIMIERWNPTLSYPRFYELCAPSYCTYSQRIHTQTIVGVMITLVSVTGGVIVSLRLITPQLVNFISRLWKLISKRRQQQQGNR